MSDSGVNKEYFIRIQKFIDRKKLTNILSDTNDLNKLTEEQLKRLDEYIEIREECDFELSEQQEYQILLGFLSKKKIDVTLYWNPKYSAILMQAIRDLLEIDISIVSILHRTKFYETDIVTLKKIYKKYTPTH